MVVCCDHGGGVIEHSSTISGRTSNFHKRTPEILTLAFTLLEYSLTSAFTLGMFTLSSNRGGTLLSKVRARPLRTLTMASYASGSYRWQGVTVREGNTSITYSGR